MKKRHLKQFKATGIIAVWGRFRYLWNSNTFYVQIIQFTSILILVFNDSIRTFIYNRTGWSLSFWIFFAVVIVVLAIGVIFEHFVTIPGSQRYASEQFVKHGPFQKFFEEQEKQSHDLKLIKEKLGIEDTVDRS